MDKPLPMTVSPSPSFSLLRCPQRFPVRPCAGVALFNAKGRVFIGRRRPKWASSDIWQMPQGGIDKGETAPAAAFRELKEETGISSAIMLSEVPGWLSFELPRDLLGVALKGRYRGQRLRWFAMSFNGDDREINVGPKGRMKSEFDAWRWADLAEVPELVAPFKRAVYETVVQEFMPFALRTAA